MPPFRSIGSSGVKPFSPDFDPPKTNLTGGGYRDINVLLRVVHHVCELQFNLQKMIDVKESAAGHGSYERIRLFNDRAIVAAIKDDTAALKSSLALGAAPWIREGKHRLSMLHFASLR